MKLHLTYPSSEEGIKLIKLFKYLKHNGSWVSYDKIDKLEYEMSYTKDETSELKLVIHLDMSMVDRTITGYDNIRIALKSIFPTLFDLTPIKRIPIAQKLKQQFKYPPHYVKDIVTNETI